LLLLACTPQAPESAETRASPPAVATREAESPRPEASEAKPAPTEPEARRVTLEPELEPERHRVVWQRTKPREHIWDRERLMAADPEGNRAWVLRASHIHPEELAGPHARRHFAELLEIDLDESRARTVLRGVVGKSNVDTYEHYGELWPLVDRPGDLAVLGDLVAAGHAVADMLVDPERERLFHWDQWGHARASDRRGAALELAPEQIFRLGFGADGSHRAYATIDFLVLGCDRGELRLTVEQHGATRQVPALDCVDAIRWSPSQHAFFASTSLGDDGDEGCVYRIAADGSEATRLICVGGAEHDFHYVEVSFAPSVRRALVASYFDVDESERRLAWLDLERGVVEAVALVEGAHEVHCLFDDGLALVLSSRANSLGLVAVAPNSARGGLLPGHFSDVACERFADGSAIALRRDLIEVTDYVEEGEQGELVEQTRASDDGRFSLVRVDLAALRP
jgi:hypothetical protein